MFPNAYYNQVLNDKKLLFKLSIFLNHKLIYWNTSAKIEHKQRLGFYKYLYPLSSSVHVWGASDNLWEMHHLVTSPYLKTVWHSKRNHFYPFVSTVMCQQRLVFYKKCLLSTCVHVSEACGVLREMPFILVCPCVRSVSHFMGNAIYRRLFFFE